MQLKYNDKINVIINDLIIYLEVSYKLIEIINLIDFFILIFIFIFIFIIIINVIINTVINKLNKIFRFKDLEEVLFKVFDIDYIIAKIK